jgi:hypothetical protein
MDYLLTLRESSYINSAAASHMVSFDFFELHLQGSYRTYFTWGIQNTEQEG